MKDCLDGYERNLKGTCIKKCSGSQIRHPITYRCRRKTVKCYKDNMDIVDGTCVKKCNRYQIRNSKTKRCQRITNKYVPTLIRQTPTNKKYSSLTAALRSVQKKKNKLPRKKKNESIANEIIDEVKNIPKATSASIEKKNEILTYVIHLMNNKLKGKPIGTKTEGPFDTYIWLMNYYAKQYTKTCVISLNISWRESSLLTSTNSKKNVLLTSMKDMNSISVSAMKLKLAVDKCALRVFECLDKQKQIAAVPILFTFDFLYESKIVTFTNLIIFRLVEKTIQWFLPFGDKLLPGASFSDIYENNIILMQYLKHKLETSNSLFQSVLQEVELIQPETLCPSDKLSTMETQFVQLNSVGYCTLWSLLIMKIVLKFPYHTIPMMMQDIFQTFPSFETLRTLTYDFINEISNILLTNYNLTNADFKELNKFFR